VNAAVLVGLLFALSFLVAGVGVVLFLAERNRQKVRRRLLVREGVREASEDLEQRILRDTALSSSPTLDKFLRRYPVAFRLSMLLSQADVSMRVGGFLALSLGVALLSGLIVAVVSPWSWAGLPAGILVGFVPLVVIYRKKEKRRALFEQQFPDSLDLMVGALRSGMALIGAFQIVAEESPEPMSTEFRMVVEENRLGVGLRESLEHLATRIDSTELRLFVTAVLIQRDTGGNLAEILEGTAFVIRDRFRILGDVRTITAQARFSGAILTVLPIIMAVILMALVPDYVKVLITDPIGPYFIAAAVVLQIVGYIAIRKIIKIKV